MQTLSFSCDACGYSRVCHSCAEFEAACGKPHHASGGGLCMRLCNSHPLSAAPQHRTFGSVTQGRARQLLADVALHLANDILRTAAPLQAAAPHKADLASTRQNGMAAACTHQAYNWAHKIVTAEVGSILALQQWACRGSCLLCRQPAAAKIT